mmetsp:Transcript_43776/g.126449  ORF Transcript_43776/g.126449 Transcript_43776/m.126449 type:complete len:220 (-) Transcript_43776:552-1211(-)
MDVHAVRRPRVRPRHRLVDRHMGASAVARHLRAPRLLGMLENLSGGLARGSGAEPRHASREASVRAGFVHVGGVDGWWWLAGRHLRDLLGHVGARGRRNRRVRRVDLRLFPNDAENLGEEQSLHVLGLSILSGHHGSAGVLLHGHGSVHRGWPALQLQLLLGGVECRRCSRLNCRRRDLSVHAVMELPVDFLRHVGHSGLCLRLRPDDYLPSEHPVGHL